MILATKLLVYMIVDVPTGSSNGSSFSEKFSSVWKLKFSHLTHGSQQSSPEVRVDQTCKTLLVVPGAHVVDGKLDEQKCRYTVEDGSCFDVFHS